ncbi:MAG: hypothetical protein HFE83_09075 [Lachnospiraceae bacterium]|nr:hypothetical protein [Lachnospiraceae bacterium]
MGKKLSLFAAMAVGAAAGAIAEGSRLNKKLLKQDETLEKVHELYILFDRWLGLRQENRSLAAYLKQRQYHSVAIYGAKEPGQRLYDELEASGITVRYMIDRNANNLNAKVEIVTPDAELLPVDAVVVTAVSCLDEIEKTLKQKLDCPVVSLEELVYEA